MEVIGRYANHLDQGELLDQVLISARTVRPEPKLEPPNRFIDVCAAAKWTNSSPSTNVASPPSTNWRMARASEVYSTGLSLVRVAQELGVSRGAVNEPPESR